METLKVTYSFHKKQQKQRM